MRALWLAAVVQLLSGLLLEAASSVPSSLAAADARLQAHACRPQHIHLALTGDPTQMRVSWSTRAHDCHGNVFFGQWLGATMEESYDAEDHLDMVVDHMDAGSYGPDDFCGEPAVSNEFAPPHLHTAVMSGLVPGAMYKYRIDDYTDIMHFQAAPETRAEAQFTFIAYGDMGESVHADAKSPGASMTADRVMSDVEEKGASLIVHLGDISYADGRHEIWETFLDQIEPFASRVPYQVVVGNHEYDWKTGTEHHHRHPVDASGEEEMYDPDWGNYGNDSGGECGVIFSKLFIMPGSMDDSDSSEASTNHKSRTPSPPFWFSYNYGGVHFATLSSEHDLTSGSHQARWLEKDLADVDRCTTPWLVVLIHRPLYVVHPHKSNRVVGEHLRMAIEDTLERHEVDLVMSGHVHAWARTCNVNQYECIRNKAGGITHLTIGNGGRKLSEVEADQPDWLEYADQKWGFARITVDGSKSLLIEYISSETGDVRDQVQLGIAPSAMHECSIESRLQVLQNELFSPLMVS